MRRTGVRSGRGRPTSGMTAGLALAALAAVPRPASGQAPAMDALAREVEARETAFAQTMADRDFAAFLTFLSEEAVFFAGDTPLRGPSAIGDAWARLYEGERAPFSWHPEVVEVLGSGGLALTSGPVLGPSGDVVGRFNSIWRRDADGVWRIVFDRGCP